MIDNENFDSGVEYGDNRSTHRKRKHTNSLFYVSQVSGTKKEVKNLIRRHAVESRRQIRISKDGVNRLRAICTGDSLDGAGSSNFWKGKRPISKDEGTYKTSSKGKGLEVKNVGGRGKKTNPDLYKCPWVLFLSPDKNLVPG